MNSPNTGGNAIEKHRHFTQILKLFSARNMNPASHKKKVFCKLNKLVHFILMFLRPCIIV